MTTIAVVEDSALIANMIKQILEEEGYAVRSYSDGTTALQKLREEPVDLAILDLKLSDMNGTELLRRLRECSDVPIIVLTGVWIEEPHQLEGFQQGADDYIIKPIKRDILAQRVKAVLRRSPGKTSNSRRPSNILERGELRMDKERRVSYWKGKRLLNEQGHDLSRSCFEIVWALAKDSGAVQSAHELTKIGYVGSLEDAILTINKAFRRADPTFDAIQNVRGIGYVFTS